MLNGRENGPFQTLNDERVWEERQRMLSNHTICILNCFKSFKPFKVGKFRLPSSPRGSKEIEFSAKNESTFYSKSITFIVKFYVGEVHGERITRNKSLRDSTEIVVVAKKKVCHQHWALKSFARTKVYCALSVLPLPSFPQVELTFQVVLL